MPIIDISPTLSPQTLNFPGDTTFTAEKSWVISKDCPVNVSKIVMSSHAGAHADAPLHYDEAGLPIDQVSLDPYLGACLVVDVKAPTGMVELAAVKAATAMMSRPPRIIFRTYQQQPTLWDENFTAIAAEVIEWLAGEGCKLIGVDTPSLDPSTSKTMDAHHAVQRHDMRILEGLVLDHVAPGPYELIALPLKMQGLDAAPVRAVLRTIDN